MGDRGLIASWRPYPANRAEAAAPLNDNSADCIGLAGCSGRFALASRGFQPIFVYPPSKAFRETRTSRLAKAFRKRGMSRPANRTNRSMNDCETLEPSAIAVAPPAENSSPWRADTLTDGVLIVLVLMLVQRSIGFLRAILFCRWLDAEQLGLWDMAFGFLMLAGPLLVLSLPGAFGRYAEYYRRRGQFRPFLLQTTAACMTLALCGAGGIVWFRENLSALIFGAPNRESLVLLLAGSLLAVAAYNYTISLFTALRAVRLASAMEFVNGVMFAVLGISLLAGWRCGRPGGSCRLWRSKFDLRVGSKLLVSNGPRLRP